LIISGRLAEGRFKVFNIGEHESEYYKGIRLIAIEEIVNGRQYLITESGCVC
jgi:hypothetical protein